MVLIISQALTKSMPILLPPIERVKNPVPQLVIMYDAFLLSDIFYISYHGVLAQIPIKAPGRARGELEITYLDEELR